MRGVQTPIADLELARPFGREVSRFGDRSTNQRAVGGGCEEMIAL